MKARDTKRTVSSVRAERVLAGGGYVAILAVVLFVGVSTSPGDVTSFTGGGASHTNIQPSQAINYIIALEGVYPSRNAVAGAPELADGGATLGMDPLIGEVTMFGGNFAPRGWALADGQLLSIASHTALFSILGTTYGGDGRTTFALPDLRGRMPVGPRSGPGLSTRSLGQRGGVENVTLTTQQMPSHNHALPYPIPATRNTGGGLSHENMQPFLGINYIMATQGIFPSRNVTTTDGPETSSSSNPYLAGMTMFAGNFAPRGWEYCDGQLLPINANQALFSLLGTTYGGDGRTTFALPDMRGRTAIGEGNGPGLTDRRLGSRFGAETDTISILEMPSHDHQPPLGTIDIHHRGGGWDHPNMAPVQTLNYVIALEGIFPSRSAVSEGGQSEQEALGASSYLGEISLFGGNFAPRGWALCQGQLLPISQYSALFSLLGTTYGGDGRTTFGLPDLRGRAALHEGQGPGLSDWRLGEKGGVETVTLNINQLPSHQHSAVPGPETAGDADGDWDIDSFDYNTFIGQYGTKAPAGMLAADFDDNGIVDLRDFSLLRAAYGLGLPAPAPSASEPLDAGQSIPEPATMILAAAGLPLLLSRKRKSR